MGLFDYLKYGAMLSDLSIDMSEFNSFSNSKKSEMLKRYNHVKTLISRNSTVLNEVFGTLDIKILYDKYLEHIEKAKSIEKHFNVDVDVDEFFLMTQSERNSFKERCYLSQGNKNNPIERVMNDYSKSLASLSGRLSSASNNTANVFDEVDGDLSISTNSLSDFEIDNEFENIINNWILIIQSMISISSEKIKMSLSRLCKCFRGIYGNNYMQFEQILKSMGQDLLIYINTNDDKECLEIENKYIYISKNNDFDNVDSRGKKIG